MSRFWPGHCGVSEVHDDPHQPRPEPQPSAVQRGGGLGCGKDGPDPAERLGPHHRIDLWGPQFGWPFLAVLRAVNFKRV